MRHGPPRFVSGKNNMFGVKDGTSLWMRKLYSYYCLQSQMTMLMIIKEYIETMVIKMLKIKEYLVLIGQ